MNKQERQLALEFAQREGNDAMVKAGLMFRAICPDGDGSKMTEYDQNIFLVYHDSDVYWYNRIQELGQTNES